ncbi:hypothetical protein [Bremerella cremea]|uniref:hypothetical protein n=1 Tax=Bremerella cremea TaxID=1031537 RepID=UPI0031E65CF1
MTKPTKQFKLSKADAIRKHLTENPGVSPAVTAEALVKAGYKDVTPQYVSTIKSMDKRKAGKTIPRGPLTSDDLLATKKFVQQFGGMERAKLAIDTLGTLGAK